METGVGKHGMTEDKSNRSPEFVLSNQKGREDARWPLTIICAIGILLQGCAATNPPIKNKAVDAKQPKVKIELIPQEKLPRGVPAERATEYALRAILTSKEFAEFEKLKTREEQEKWVFRYWSERNPRPDRPQQNPYREEVLERILNALERFPAQGTPQPWDDRGEVWIRQGEPKDRLIQESGSDSMWTKEVWTYPSIEYTFKDLNGTGEFRLTEAGYFGITPRSPSDIAMTTSKMVATVRQQGVHYAYDYGKALKVIDRVEKFRQAEKSTGSDVFIQWAVRLRDLLKPFSDTAKYSWRVVAYDLNGNVVCQDSASETRKITTPVDGQVFINQCRLWLPPGNYTYALAVEGSGGLGLIKRKEPLIIPEYVTLRERSISDLMLPSLMKDVTGDSIPAELLRFVRTFEGHEYLIVPSTGQIFQGDLLNLYAELYYLTLDTTTEKGVSRFRAKISLVSQKGQTKRFLLADQELEGEGQHVPLLKAFSTEKIPPGEYIVNVEVEDLLAKPTDSKRKLTILGPVKINKRSDIQSENSEK